MWLSLGNSYRLGLGAQGLRLGFRVLGCLSLRLQFQALASAIFCWRWYARSEVPDHEQVCDHSTWVCRIVCNVGMLPAPR